MKQPFKAIVAVSQNGVIGKNGDLPWRLAEDLKWFKKITMGHVVLMGRKTWDSLPFPLPGRKNWVISRSLEKKRACRSLAPLKKQRETLTQRNKFLSLEGEKFMLKPLLNAEKFMSLKFCGVWMMEMHFSRALRKILKWRKSSTKMRRSSYADGSENLNNKAVATNRPEAR
tara:strand:+ start:53 stop:565 length:513 start_codon:yes stop_codon:yes gene_type:complete